MNYQWHIKKRQLRYGNDTVNIITLAIKTLKRAAGFLFKVIVT